MNKKIKILISVLLLVGLFVGIYIFAFPAIGKTFYKKGMSEFQDKNYTEAIPDFKKAIFFDKNNAEYYAYLGYSYHRENKLKEAEWAYKKALSMSYKTQIFFYSLGFLYEKSGDINKAIIYYKKSVDLNPQEYTPAYYGLISGLLYTKNDNEAITIAKKLTTLQKTARAFGFLGYSYARNNIFDKSYEAYNKAAELQPKNPIWLIKLGRLLLLENKTKDAITTINKSLIIDPKNINALCSLSLAYNSQSEPNYEKSIFYAKKAVDIYDSSYNKSYNTQLIRFCLYNLGYAYFYSNDYVSAKVVLERDLKLMKEYNKYIKPSYNKDLAKKYIKSIEDKLKKISQQNSNN